MNDDRSQSTEGTDALETPVNPQVTDAAESGGDGEGEDGLAGDGTLGSASGVPIAHTKLGAVPSSYGEPGGAGENAEGLPPA